MYPGRECGFCFLLFKKYIISGVHRKHQQPHAYRVPMYLVQYFDYPRHVSHLCRIVLFVTGVTPPSKSSVGHDVLLRGAIVNRTYVTHKKLDIYLFLSTIFGPIYYAPRISMVSQEVKPLSPRTTTPFILVDRTDHVTIQDFCLFCVPYPPCFSSQSLGIGFRVIYLFILRARVFTPSPIEMSGTTFAHLCSFFFSIGVTTPPSKASASKSRYRSSCPRD